MSEVCNEYGKALFMLAQEEDAVKEYKESLDTISSVFKENPVYMEFLSSFAIPLEERISAIESAFSNAISRNVVSFLKILCEKRHIMEFNECAEQYIALYNEMDKISNAKVTSVVELSDKEKEALKEKLEKMSSNKIIIEYIVDKSILGGLIVEIDDKIIDSSLKKHLEDVKDVIKR